MTVRLPIVQKPPWFCAQRLQRGDVRRWAAKGKSFSYVVCCPSCGRPTMVMVDEWGLEEGPIVRAEAPMSSHPNALKSSYEYPETMTSTKLVRCRGCAGQLSVTGRELTLTPLVKE